MYFRSVKLHGVRNYAGLSLEFGPGLNLLFGDNAAGKTNLLEAVFYSAALRSFRGAKPRDLIRWKGGGHADERAASSEGAGGPDTDTGRITATVAPITGGRSHTLSVSLDKDGRRISLDGKKPESVSKYLLTLKPSGFSPEDLFLAREYPSHRRRFVDRAVFHLEPGYIKTANGYRQAVSQLNAALKSGDEKVVATYEELMAPLAAHVAYKRETYLRAIQPYADEVFQRILAGAMGAGGVGEDRDMLAIDYRGGTEGGAGEIETLTRHYAGRLRAKRAEGMKRGYASVGPHTEDISLTLGGRDMKSAASRGQGRLAYLAMVLADARLYRERTGKHPVLLLDDVVSELDEKRAGALIDYVSGLGQTIITATDDRFVLGRECRRFRVEGGMVVEASG